ncbi:putative endo-beta-1 [Hyphodiscus hymeniophilus]|uniref:AA9 family lytic polysaccharide monooxygenase n=1 Tax=Hyphodiscus hymeniophilus TaxID=353542 RepID=A0A9P7AV62_9HELO|nr:putative endo-beta-1 [Hyphodiscus hymeniophilus]
MKSSFILAAAALAVQQVAGHATFQDLWVNGVDEICTLFSQQRMWTDSAFTKAIVSGCNVNGLTGVAHKCVVPAGSTVAVEMHQQPGDRTCATDAIGGDHYGPVQVYLTKVADATTADGSTGWFKIFEDTWSAVAGASTGSDDNWGTKDLNTCCGKMAVKIPSDIPSGDYLLRAEVIALHVAGQLDGAQFYMSCYQITVTGGGSASPPTVLLPGAYSANDPGILINIYQTMTTYVVPGPSVYSGGLIKTAGAACSGVETVTTTGPAYTGGGAVATSSTGKPSSGTTVVTTLKTTTSVVKASTSTSAPATSTKAPSGCTAAKYAQCGGTGFTGCTTCAAGSTCSAVSPPYYSQCV